MKNRFKIKLATFFISVFICLNTYGQNTYMGRIVVASELPWHCFLDVSSSYCICDSNPSDMFSYFSLYLNSLPITHDSGRITIDSVEYFEGDIVIVTGISSPLYPGSKDYRFDVDTIKKRDTISSQIIQRFLGNYSQGVVCINQNSTEDLCEIHVSIEKGVGYDLRVTIKFDVRNTDSTKSFDAIISNDSSFFIPYHYWYDEGDPYAITFKGAGEIRNNSFFLCYVGTKMYCKTRIKNIQNIQRFLGTYSITAMCEHHYGEFSETRYVIIEEGVYSDLLIHFSYWHTGVEAFVSNDSLFIPYQEWVSDGLKSFLSGNGKIRDDSICLSYFSGTISIFPPYNLLFGAECDNCKKNSSNIVITAKQNKIYYNAVNQTIIIDAVLQNQSLILELVDMLGKLVLRKTNVSNPISIANLPQGVYVYRLLQDNQIICRGKILK